MKDKMRILRQMLPEAEYFLEDPSEDGEKRYIVMFTKTYFYTFMLLSS